MIQEVEIAAEAVGSKVSGTLKLDKSGVGQNPLSLLNLVNSVSRKMRDIVQHQYYILIDDLDLYWEDNPVQNSFIAALFTSLSLFSRPPHIKAVVALRDNIFESLPLVDRDKYPDIYERLRWDYKSVKEMIEKRIIYKYKVVESEIWGEMFVSDAMEQLWNRSSGRPREVIRLTTIALKTAFEQCHTKVEQEDLDAAIIAFSNERIQEIASEYKYKYPALEILIRRMNGWPKEFPYKKIADLIDLMATEVLIGEKGADKYSWIAGFQQNPIDLITILLNCNILWIKLSRTDSAKPYDPNVHNHVTTERWFAIHPMFGPGLGLIGE